MLADRGLLKVGGLLVADNVLWKGMAPDEWYARQQDSNGEEGEGGLVGAGGVGGAGRGGLGVAGRHGRIAGSMVDFLAEAAEPGSRWEQVVLPVRDGLSLSRRLR